MSPEDIVLELNRRFEEKNALGAHGFESAPSGGGELFWLVVVLAWALASAWELLDAERQARRDSAWLWAGSYAASALVAGLLFG